jgi:putative endonuclease
MTDAARSRRGAKAHRTGVLAEDSAARFLERQGYTILARRHRTPHGEIDLIAKDGAVLVFIEVKARPTRIEAAHSLTARQWARLEGAALHYMAETGETNTDMRFDVVLVSGDGICERVENARSFDEF